MLLVKDQIKLLCPVHAPTSFETSIEIYPQTNEEIFVHHHCRCSRRREDCHWLVWGYGWQVKKNGNIRMNNHCCIDSA